MPNEVQTHFVTMKSPAHHGNQGYLHQDINYFLAPPNGNLIRPPIARDLHRPLSGQTQLNDFMVQKLPGIH